MGRARCGQRRADLASPTGVTTTVSTRASRTCHCGGRAGASGARSAGTRDRGDREALSCGLRATTILLVCSHPARSTCCPRSHACVSGHPQSPLLSEPKPRPPAPPLRLYAGGRTSSADQRSRREQEEQRWGDYVAGARRSGSWTKQQQ
ncbi:hypothetical protein L226DRAFT_239261 [Lentinus tigrinus ALCF2SS1-7]|uniref:Uncharacterized protein n=1 Tax=Lentinus tigrinus ALCF2SS1-6 TaxID=1328759 RepID=A0A5C2SNV6_9APHY|nr:hypothetical protein L227DRAFT_214698 [Lentinus tigrinus ALCF2SS1-6]RPD79064.1 hypothetical protein L226DRAFT_239261 [Lentinus tigrinus ALCF2SS1-7]